MEGMLLEILDLAGNNSSIHRLKRVLFLFEVHVLTICFLEKGFGALYEYTEQLGIVLECFYYT